MHRFLCDMRARLSGLYPQREIESMARILTYHYLGLSPVEACLYPDRKHDEGKMAKMRSAVRQLQAYRPIQYITETTEFYGLPFRVTPDVLIPRPETEELVEWVVRSGLPHTTRHPAILDIGTGSGCIAVALASAFPGAEVWATDISREALDVAAHNAKRNGVHIRAVHADILSEESDSAFAGAHFDLIVSNPPYIAAHEKDSLPANVLDHEPHIALFPASGSPLEFYERIAVFGKKHLTPQGTLFFEINGAFPEETAAILKNLHYTEVTLRKDIHEKWRLLKGTNS
jgi:release factor glutamine methyltransferase